MMRSNGEVRVTSESAMPETSIEPVKQRLATAKPATFASKDATKRPQANQLSDQKTTRNQAVASRNEFRQKTNPKIKQTAAEQVEELGQLMQAAYQEPAENESGERASQIRQVSHRSELSDKADKPADDSQKIEAQRQLGELPGQYAGVDVTELMEALGDAPPEVRKEAIRRLMAMSRRKAQSSGQPKSIDDLLSASLGSLPELPNEVIDDGLSPSRIASRENVSEEETTMRLSDQQRRPTPMNINGGKHASMQSDKDSVELAVMEKTIPRKDLSTSKQSTAIAQTSSLQAGQDAQATQTASFTSDSLTDAQLFDALVKRLQQPAEGENEGERNRRLITARHLMVLAGDPDRAVSKLDGLTEEEQEYLRHQLLGLWTIVDPNGHPVPSRRFTSALPQIREATKFLAAATDSLDVRALEFCTEIEAYGQIKPFPNRRFRPGQEVILYCEIENFVADRVDNGFQTTLQGSYDIVDESGRRVSSQSLPLDKQVSKNQLRDYFIAYQMYLPEAMESGRYRLRLTMEDVHGKKYGQSEIEFEIKR